MLQRFIKVRFLWRDSCDEILKHLSSQIHQESPQRPEISQVQVTDRLPYENDLLENVSRQSKSPLEKCNEDLSDVGPYLAPTFNFAAYVNKSEVLQELLKLGVNLHKLEKKVSVPPFILGLDFRKNIKPLVEFLHNWGLTIDNIGQLITKNPYIFKEDLETITIRINYLHSKKFSKDMILRILSKNPFWLMFSTQRIDRRLGHFQQQFSLTGDEVRALATKQPRLITYSMRHIKLNTFVLKEEMGFNDKETKEIILNKPNLLMKDQNFMLKTFEYVHREMGISTELIMKVPEVLTCREHRIKQRHLFLLKLGKAQYNPKEANYVSLKALISGTDADFCNETAKCPVQSFNSFLKTL